MTPVKVELLQGVLLLTNLGVRELVRDRNIIRKLKVVGADKNVFEF